MIKEELIYYRRRIESIKSINDRIEVLEYNMANVKGINYDKPLTHGSSDPSAKLLRFIDQCEDLEKLNILLEAEKTRKEIIDNMLYQLSPEDYELINLKFLIENPLSYEQLGKLKCYDKGNMYKKVKAIIDRMEQM